MPQKNVQELIGINRVKNAAASAILKVAAEVPDAWPTLSKDEQERLTRRADSVAAQLVDEIIMTFEKVMTRIMAEGRPHFIFNRGKVTVSEKGLVTLILSGPLADFPKEGFSHAGPVLCELIETQRDLLAEMDKETDEDQDEDDQGDQGKGGTTNKKKTTKGGK